MKQKFLKFVFMAIFSGFVVSASAVSGTASKTSRALLVPASSIEVVNDAALKSAIENAVAGQTIVLSSDISLSEMVQISQAITLDLNGKKVTAASRKAFEVYADVTIKNGSITAKERCVDTRKAVNLTLEDVVLTVGSSPAQPLTIGGNEDGTVVTMNNVTISAEHGYGIITFVKTTLEAEDSDISGYNALYVKQGSEESTFAFRNTALSGSLGSNDTAGNSFSVIAVRANNVTVTADAESPITATGNYNCALSLGGVGESTEGGSVTLAGTITGNVLSSVSLAGNTVKVKADYADALKGEGLDCVANGDGTISVNVYGDTIAEYTIVDGDCEEYVFNSSSEKSIVATLTYEREFSAEGVWNALYVPFEIPVALLGDYDVAYINDVHSSDTDEDGDIDDMSMELIKIKNGTLKANYPYLIRATSETAKEMQLAITDAVLYQPATNTVTCSSVFMRFDVTGLYETKTASELGDIYAIGTTGDWNKAENSSQTLKPFRFYLEMEKIDGSFVVIDEDALANIRIRVVGEKDEATGIVTPVASESADDKIYDLQGRPVSTLVKGSIYIVGGKKVMWK